MYSILECHLLLGSSVCLLYECSFRLFSFILFTVTTYSIFYWKMRIFLIHYSIHERDFFRV